MNETDGGSDRKHGILSKFHVLPLVLSRYRQLVLLRPGEISLAGPPTQLGVKWVKVTRRGERTVLESVMLK